MTQMGKRIFVDLVLATLLAVAAIVITVLVHSIGVLIAIPFIEAAIYALWHAKNVFFAEPSIEVNIYERTLTKVPSAKKTLKQDFKNEVLNEPKGLNFLSMFKKHKEKKTEAHHETHLGNEFK